MDIMVPGSFQVHSRFSFSSPSNLLRLRDFLLPIFDATGQTVAKVACTGERMALLKGWLAELFVASDFPGQRSEGLSIIIIIYIYIGFGLDLELIHGVA